MKKLILTALFVLAVSVAPALGFIDNQYYTLEVDQGCNNVIGIMPHVEIITSSNAEVCVQWYENGAVALAPNADVEMGYYCRTTDAEGKTFFAMRSRFAFSRPITPAGDCENGTWDSSSIDLTTLDIGLNVLSINGAVPNYPFVVISF